MYERFVIDVYKRQVLVRPESIRCLVDAALQPDDQIVQARADIGIPLVGGPARLDVAGHKVGLGSYMGSMKQNRILKDIFKASVFPLRKIHLQARSFKS